ncbi:MAG: hypothetical protein SPJ13_06190 [Bacteroidales bacterium]|nr:hypothetical protein [Bacteroidales bacterium]
MQIVLERFNWKIVSADLLLVGAACLIPAVSHITALPLYKVDPMRWLLLAGILLSARRGNGYVLAAALPLVACMVSGMPTPVKAFIMALELGANVALFHILEKKVPVLPAMLLAILGAKMVYYLLKWIVLSPTVLISTNVWMQLMLMVAMSLFFTFGMKVREAK